MRRHSISSPPRWWFLLILSCLSAAAGFSAADAAAPINLDVLSRDGYGIVPIKRPLPNDLTVRATVNGRAVTLILDTGFGSDGITLDGDYARSLHVKPESVKDPGISVTGRKLAITKATADVVVLGNVQIKGVPLFFGIFHALRMQEARKSVGADGFIGVGFMRTNSAIIDLQNLRLYLRPPGTGRRVQLGPALQAVGLSEIPFSGSHHGHFLVDAEINGATGKMVIDTGATLTHVDTRFASQMKAFGYDAGISAIDAAGVASETTMTRARTLKLGGVIVRAPDVIMSQLSFYSASDGKVIGVVGMDVLGQNWGIIDVGQEKLYLAGVK